MTIGGMGWRGFALGPSAAAFFLFLNSSGWGAVLASGVAYGWGLAVIDRWVAFHPRLAEIRRWHQLPKALFTDLAWIGFLFLVVGMGGWIYEVWNAQPLTFSFPQFAAAALIAYFITEIGDWLAGGHYAERDSDPLPRPTWRG